MSAAKERERDRERERLRRRRGHMGEEEKERGRERVMQTSGSTTVCSFKLICPLTSLYTVWWVLASMQCCQNNFCNILSNQQSYPNFSVPKNSKKSKQNLYQKMYRIE